MRENDWKIQPDDREVCNELRGEMVLKDVDAPRPNEEEGKLRHQSEIASEKEEETKRGKHNCCCGSGFYDDRRRLG